jgi:phosphatidylethanolamine-binding protein (PEBP) family uncharacterized protein
MGLIFRKSNSRKLWKTKRRTRNKYRKLRSKKQRGGAARMIIKYAGGIQLASGQMNLDMTQQYIQGNLNQQPQLELTGLEPSRKYLITMTDPDALGKTWTHWVAIISGSASVLTEIANYKPPSPPPGSGMHHYEFRLYDINGNAGLRLPRKLEDGTNERGTYFSQVLAPFIKDEQRKNEIKLILEASYIVDSDRI